MSVINKELTQYAGTDWSLGSLAYVKYVDHLAKVQITEAYYGCAGCIFRSLFTQNCPKCLPSERVDKKRIIFKKIDEVPLNKL
jgi:hypothetical protein